MLPFVIAKIHRRAYDEGLAEHQSQFNSYSAALNKDISQLVVARKEDQIKHNLTVGNLKRTITELEERIMSYTGLAVTRADYEQLLAAAETLRLAERTLTAMKATTQGVRAAQQASNLGDLAKRVHAQLRSAAATTARMENAA